MKTMHVLQHAGFEGPANIGAWCRKNDVQVSATCLYETGWSLPKPADMEALVVMGGPMSVHDEKDYPWLVAEKRLIEAAIGDKKIVIGVCLGAQLLADVLGARVYPAPEREIGWFPIKKTREAAKLPLFSGFDDEQTVFHWHGDTYDLPPRAVNLFTSESCVNQGFVFDDNVVGLQFHIEVGPEHIEKFLANGESDLAKGGKFVQSAEEIRAGMSSAKSLEKPLESMLDQLAYFCLAGNHDF